MARPPRAPRGRPHDRAHHPRRRTSPRPRPARSTSATGGSWTWIAHDVELTPARALAPPHEPAPRRAHDARRDHRRRVGGRARRRRPGDDVEHHQPPPGSRHEPPHDQPADGDARIGVWTSTTPRRSAQLARRRRRRARDPDERHGRARARSTTDTTIVGTTRRLPDRPRVRRSGRGRSSAAVDVERDLRVAVLGTTDRRRPGPRRDAIGTDDLHRGPAVPGRRASCSRRAARAARTPTTRCSCPSASSSKYFSRRRHRPEHRRERRGRRRHRRRARPRSRPSSATATTWRPTDDDDFSIFDQAQLLDDGVVDQRDADAPARRHRLDLAHRRRHRDHEHHAGLGPRADARDRHPQGDRRPRARHPRPVPHRGADPVAPRRR